MSPRWSIPLRGAALLLALSFGLAMVGPDAHQCSVHDQPATAAGAPSHATHAPVSHDTHQGGGHQHCTCPQACCPIGIGVALMPTSVRLVPALAPVWHDAPVFALAVPRGAAPHLLPFALAPPHALA